MSLFDSNSSDYEDDYEYQDWVIEEENRVRRKSENDEKPRKKQKTDHVNNENRISPYVYLSALKLYLVDDVIRVIQTYESDTGQTIDRHFDSTITTVIFESDVEHDVWPFDRTIEIFNVHKIAMWYLRYPPASKEALFLESFPETTEQVQIFDQDCKFNSPDTILFVPYPRIYKIRPNSEIVPYSVMAWAVFRKLAWDEKMPNDHFQVRFSLNGNVLDNRVIGQFSRHVSQEMFRKKCSRIEVVVISKRLL